MVHRENEVRPVKLSKREVINKLVARTYADTEDNKADKEAIELYTLRDYRNMDDITFSKAMEEFGLFLSPLGNNKFYLMLTT